jgi:hypothetical protein
VQENAFWSLISMLEMVDSSARRDQREGAKVNNIFMESRFENCSNV